MKGELLDIAKRCIRCGFCLEACPTYKLTGREAASPRGRIRLMTAVLQGSASLSADVVEALDLCLGCRACETACPSGVRYSALIEHFRARVNDSLGRTRAQNAARGGLIKLMTSPEAFAASLALGGLRQRLLGTETLPGPVARVLAGDQASALALPVSPSSRRVGSVPYLSPALGTRRYRVAFLQGCVMRVLYDHVNQATVRMLQRVGCDVVCPEQAGCCGALDLHAGFVEHGKAEARALMDALSREHFDALVSNSAGCGSTLREYGDVLSDDPVWRAAASALADKVRDVSEFLLMAGLPEPTRRLDAVVTYHDACHLVHGQGVRDAPRRLLESVPGLKLVPLHESDMCCGSAGTYNVTQPEMARRLLERKVGNIARTGAQIVLMGNPGCMAWIEKGIREHGLDIRVMHLVELLDSLYVDELSPDAQSGSKEARSPKRSTTEDNRTR